jgi:hypothetical protein
MAASGGKLLSEAEGIQTHSHAIGQNRSELFCNDPYRRRHHKRALNLNNP